jgi:secondary thiamine-phosphate synthase enzyme
MRIEQRILELDTTTGTDVLDLSDEIDRFLADAGISEGTLLVFTPGSTAAVTTLEYESGCVEDLKRALEQIAPADGDYAHNLRWGDGNGYSHLRSALIGGSFTVPVSGGRTITGTWQQIILCDFDNKPRRRKVVLQVTGE